MFPILQIGPAAVQVPGLALLAGLWLALSAAEKEANRIAEQRCAAAGPLSAEAIYSVALAGLVAGLVGARLAYVLRYLGAYAADPLGILALNPATLAQTEGVLVGLVTATVWGARRKLRLWPTLDALAPGVAVMGIAIAVAHLASGDAFGAPTSVPWRIFLWDDYRHPAQVYELLAAVCTWGLWRWQARQPAAAGVSFVRVAAMMAGARLFLEAFRGDSVLLAGGLRAAQVWAWLALAACLIWLGGHAQRGHAAPPPS
jgi:prolipoprotein diacylglyceryltransferase